jgi:hypothetical protein
MTTAVQHRVTRDEVVWSFGPDMDVDQWGFSIEEAFAFLSVACDANICQACRPQDFSTIARVAISKVSATPRSFA